MSSNPRINLNPDQKTFLAHACGFIDTHPSREEVDKLLTLAVMLLPAPVAEMLSQRANQEASGPAPGDLQLSKWLQ